MNAYSTFARSRRNRLTLVLLALAASALTGTLLAGPKEAPAPVAPDHAEKMARGLDLFKKQVRGILSDRCLKCHGGKRVEGDFDLSDRAALLKGGDAGPAILPGRSRDSLLYKLIAHAKQPHMPHKAKKLPDAEIAALAAWVDLGAPYDTSLKGAKTTETPWTQRVVAVEAKQFWSFQPLKRPELPAVKDPAWCKTLADRFILAKLEAAGMQPNPPASNRQLIRRTYYDLLGLPPTSAEVDAFLADTTSTAYEKMIDRLLTRPQYGERWGRHWLDLARFAESHGFEHDYDRPTAYHYRDFVIEALNNDLPFDTFVKWQLAGDELAPDNNLALKATGFLAAGVHSTQITKNEVEKHRYDEMDDMLATVGTSMLGLTVGCARCHDHKFDPIPQRDYYRMLATFTTTVRSEVDLNVNPEIYRAAKARFDRDHAPLAAALTKFETEQLPARLTAWEQSPAAQQLLGQWQTLDAVSLKSSFGTTFTKLPDASILAGGKNPPHDTYVIVAHTDRVGISAVRLEALADASMVKGGPGRAANGNFALSDFRLTVQPKGVAGAKPTPVKLRNARATFEQKGLPVAAAIDMDRTSSWAVDPQFGKDHAAVFDTDAPVGFPGGTVLTFSLDFRNNTGHNIGRPRLSITTAGSPLPLTAPGVPQQILPILKTPAAERKAPQKAALLQWYRTIDPDWRRLNEPVQAHLLKSPKAQLVKAMIASEGLPAVRLHTQGADFLDATNFLRRGDPNQKDGPATQSFLQVLMPSAEGAAHWQSPPPAGSRTSHRRKALATWLTDIDSGAGRLLARVIVNRLWQHHMGRGIVATPSDFGNRGELPSHPKLLDWLATELIRNGWHLKPIHKLIMTSAVYRQSSHLDPAKMKADHQNHLFWHRPRQRLEAEVVRDGLLAVGGLLDATMFGPGTLDPASRRRSIYFTVKRSKLISMMTVFDAPDALAGIGDRPTTTIAPQALLLMNNPQVRASARGFANRIAPDAKTPLDDAIRAGYLAALTRPPDAEELSASTAFVQQQLESYRAAGKADARAAALTDFCQALMCLNEFVYAE